MEASRKLLRVGRLIMDWIKPEAIGTQVHGCNQELGGLQVGATLYGLIFFLCDEIDGAVHTLVLKMWFLPKTREA